MDGKKKKAGKAPAAVSSKKEGKKKKKLDTTVGMTGNDDRFEHIGKDRRFKPISRKQTTVKIDSRFAGMFTDKSFTDNAGASSATSDLKRFYRIEDEGVDTKKKGKKGKGKAADDEFDDEGDQAKASNADAKFTVDYSRGEVLLESSDEEELDDEQKEEEEEEPGIDVWGGGLIENHERVGIVEEDERTARLAFCNLDWHQIKAMDIFVMANSFKPPQGAIKKVTIYPSEFGLERMAIEDAEGPARFLRGDDEGKAYAKEGDGDGFNVELETIDQVDQDKLRAYEIAKLKYYYAVVEVDSVETAIAIYTGCDGLEWEQSQNILDLRYIPDDTEFDEEPKDVCVEMPSEHEFNPEPFETKALGHTKVGLSWDEEDKDDNLRLTKRKFNKQELENMDYSAYLASDTDDSLSEDEDGGGGGSGGGGGGSRGGMAALLAECQEAEDAEMPQENMEVTWDLGLKERTEEALKRRQERIEESGMTLGEKHEKKQKDKKKARKQLIKERIAASKAGSSGNGVDSDSDDEDMSARAGGDDAFFKQDFGEGFAPRGAAGSSAIASSDESSDAGDSDGSEGGDGGGGNELDAEALAAAAGDADAGEGHFDMRKIAKEHKLSKKKKLKKKGKNKRGGADDDEDDQAAADNFKLNVADSRFGAVFDNKDFAIDKTVPEFKDTREMQRLIDERQARVRKTTKESSKKRKADKKAAKAAASSGKSGKKHTPGPVAPADQDGILAELVASVKDKYAKGGPKNKRFKGDMREGEGSRTGLPGM